jgi:GT2 family glycosyltransferase
MNKTVFISLVMWKRWEDTIECIESLLKQDYKNFKIILIDNASPDNSVEKVIRYLNREIHPHIPEHTLLKNFITPVGTSKIDYTVISEENFTSLSESMPTVTIVRNSENYGYGKAMNQTMKLLGKAEFNGYIWILNNDTIMPTNALSALVNDLESDTQNGMSGSVMFYYDDPEILQCAGGAKFYPQFGAAKMIGKNKTKEFLQTTSKETLVSLSNYLPGTAVLISKECIASRCLFDDKNFHMYAEDIDLSFQVRNKGWKISVAKESVVYHKEGKSTAGKKEMFFYLYNRGNTIFIKKYFPFYYFCIAIPAMIVHTVKMNLSLINIWFAIKGIWSGLTFKLHK